MLAPPIGKPSFHFFAAFGPFLREHPLFGSLTGLQYSVTQWNK